MFKNLFLNQFLKKKALPLLFGATGLTMFNLYNNYQQNLKCCGIIGVISIRNNTEKIVLDGIELLQNRGYDSAGIATIIENQKEIQITKLASDNIKKIDCIEELKIQGPERHKGSIAGIGHTRWATCGGKTDANSHPHCDTQKRIYLVHNGTLDNYKEIKEEMLQNKNVNLTSETDTELIAQLIGLKLSEGLNLFDAVKNIVETKIEGQWGLVCMDRNEPNKLVCARNGSPILIGLHEDSIFVASEKIAFEKYTDNFISMRDGEVIELDLNHRREFYRMHKNRVLTITDKNIVQKTPKIQFKSFFEQEIYDQPDTLMRTLGNGSRIAGAKDTSKLGGLERCQKEIVKIENIVLVACGSSYLAAQFSSTFFKKLDCFNSINIIEGSEFTEYDLPKQNPAMLCISQSGETADIRKGLDMAKKAGLFTMGVINSVGSQIASSVDCGVYLNCGREVAVAATKSFTSQVVALLLVAVWVSQKKEEHLDQKKNQIKRIQLIKALRQIPTGVGSTLVDIHEICKQAAKLLYKESSIICLGKGACSAIAKEGALKLKELTYIHAEAFSAGELKHGPLALIDPDHPQSTAVILIILDDEYLQEMQLALSEVKSREALTIVITDCADKLVKSKIDLAIEIQSDCGELNSILTVLPFQIITNEICVLLQRNPDKPRNLAKCVTVK